MTDARQPLPGSTSYIQNTTTQQSSSNFNVSGEGRANVLTATQFKIGANRVLSNPGTDNIFVGVGAGTNNAAGRGNSFFGTDPGFNNTTSGSNSFFGTQTGGANISGEGNTFIGFNAGYVLQVQAKKYFFPNPTQIVTVHDEIADLDFTSED